MTTEAFKQEASRTPNTETVVKALQWQKRHESEFLSRAETILGVYRVWSHHEANGEWFWSLSDGAQAALDSPSDGSNATEAEAKAAAQAGFDQRIRSALASPPSPAEVTSGITRQDFETLTMALSDIADFKPEDGGDDPHSQIAVFSKDRARSAIAAVFHGKPLPAPPAQEAVTDGLAQELSSAADDLKAYADKLPAVHYSHRHTGPAILAMRKAVEALQLGKEG